MSDSLVDDRRFNAVVLVASVAAYAVALVDASDWVAGPLLVPVALMALRVVVPSVPAPVVLVVTTAIVAALNVDLNAEGAFFLVCMAAFATTATSDPGWLARVLVVAAALSPGIDVAIGSDAVRDWNWPFWSMGVAVSGLFGEVLSHQRRLTAALAEAQTRLADQAAGEERRRIAREVHDLVGHSLTVVLLHVTGARHVVRRDPGEAEAALAEAERAGRQSLADIRRTVSLLRDDNDGRAPTPTGVDIADLIADSCAAGLSIRHEIRGPIDALDEAVGLTAYRIVQESLANVARHAPDAVTEVAIAVTSADVDITVANTATSRLRPPTDTDGTGMIGMQERATAAGGTLVAGPHNGGWRVRAVLPRVTASTEVDA